MKLSDGEKLILLMLGELYEKIGIKDGIDAKFVSSAIYSGHEWALPWKFTGIPFDSQDTPEHVEEVLNILDMWTFIEEAYAEMGPAEKEKIKTDADPFGAHVRFRGFDGNNESEYLSAAGFLINDLDRFSRFKGRDLNSHSPSIGSHRRMYQEFEVIRPTLIMRGLSVEEIVKLLNAQRHPDNR